MTSRRPASRRVAAVLAVWIAATTAVRAAETDDEAATAGKAPDATIAFRGHTAAVGLGFVWGASTLEYQGKTYPVRVDGFVVGGVGTASITAVGKVYGLANVEDLNGDFTALGATQAFGAGSGVSRLRNEKGVRIVLEGQTSGLQLGAGARGITIAVGEAGGPPADASFRLPPTLGFGQARIRGLLLRPTLNVQLVGFAEGNPGFGGQWSFGPVSAADRWFETSNEVGMNARYDTEQYGSFTARVSGVFSLTGGGVDGAVSNGSTANNHAYTLESAFLVWKSGNLFPGLGFNALEIGGGNQNYQVFDGLIFWDGGKDNGTRGANWLSPRKAFRDTGIVRLNLADVVLEGFHLKLNDDPNTHTRLVGGRVEYVKDDWLMKHLKVGFIYFNIYDSQTASRQGLNGYYGYSEANPLTVLPDFAYTASYIYENNSNAAGLSGAVGWYVAPSYQLSSLPWKPQIFYRYAAFSGGGTRNFDSLFTGLPDWGSWFQGEILGEFVLSDSNLRSNQVRVKMQPSDALTLNLIYYKFLLYNKHQDFGVTPSRVGSSNLADEVDAILDYSLANWWSISATFDVAVPGPAFREAVNGSATWISGMLYTNFNF